MMTSNIKVHFKGVDPSATEGEFIDFLARSAGGIKPVNVKFFNPKGQIAVYKHGAFKHCVAEYAKPEEASAVVALFGVLIETCEFKGRKLTSVAFFTDNSGNYSNNETRRSEESGMNGKAGSLSPRYQNGQGAAAPEPEHGPVIQKFKLCVYNIPANAEKAQLKAHLEQMSGVEIVDLFFVGTKTGKTQFKNGFVTYANNEQAEKVKAMIDGGTCQFMGSLLAANYAFEKNSSAPVHARLSYPTDSPKAKQSQQSKRPGSSNYDQPQSSNVPLQNRLNFNSASTPSRRPGPGSQDTSGPSANGFGNGTRTRPVTSMIRQGGQGRASDTGNSSLTGSTATLVPNGYQNNSRPMRDANQRPNRPPFIPTSKEFSTTQAMVQGLPIGINKQMLIDAFSPYGELQYAYASAPKPDRSFIIGFIGYESPESLERMWNETKRRIVINGNEYEVKPAFHKEYEMLEKTLERRGTAFAGSQETKSTVSASNQQQQSSSSPRAPPTHQSDLSGYQATPETAVTSVGNNQKVLTQMPVASDSNPPAPLSASVSSLPATSNSSPLKSLPVASSSSSSSFNITKLPTLANINFIDLCQQSLIPVTPKKYNNYMDFVFEVRDVIVNRDLQKMLDEAGQKAPVGAINYVVPGEIVIAENPKKPAGTFNRFVVRNFSVDTDLALLEDLDSCEQYEISVETLRPINDELCALPVAHFHGGLINCAPLPGKLDEVNDLVGEVIMGEDQSADAPIYVQVYRQIYNWVDCEASDKDIVDEAFSKIIIEAGGVAREPQTSEEWTRSRAIDPVKLTKGVDRECTVVVDPESPNDISLHVNDIVDGDTLCSVWPSIELNPVPNYRPFPMEVVCTLHDDQWLRANVLSVTSTCATLYCIDWGDMIEQPFSKIRPATSQFLHDDQQNTIPGMAIRVSMQGLKYPTKFTEGQVELFKSICKTDDNVSLKILELNKRRRAYVGEVTKNGENLLELCLQKRVVDESSLTELPTKKVDTSEQVQNEASNDCESSAVEAELQSAISNMDSLQINGETSGSDLSEQVAQMAEKIRKMEAQMNVMMERINQLENTQN